MKNTSSLFAPTYGVIMACAGLEHGIGEILQGNVAPGGLIILSWPTADFFRNLGGEPAMTILPNMLLTGVLAVIVSLALLLWSILGAQRKSGGWVMIGLSIVLLLVGGGIFPPIFGILIGAAAIYLNRPVSAARSGRLQRGLAAVWPYGYAASVLGWLCLMPAGYFFGEDYPAVILLMPLFILGAMILTAVSGRVKDGQTQARRQSL